jgi:CBS domain-containing protein
MRYRETQAIPDTARRRLTVADIMTAGPRIRSPSGTGAEAVVIIRDEDCGGVTVVVEVRPIEAVTDRNGVPAVAENVDSTDQPVSDITSRGARPVRPNDPLEVVKEKFGDPKVRRLVVMDSGNQVLGIIARADLDPTLPGEVVEEAVERAPVLDAKRGGG